MYANTENASAVAAVLSGDAPYYHSLHGFIANWDVSRVTNMARLFEDGINFTGDLSRWNVSRVTI